MLKPKGAIFFSLFFCLPSEFIGEYNWLVSCVIIWTLEDVTITFTLNFLCFYQAKEVPYPSH